MNRNSMGRIILAVVLSISLIATGCSAQWISVALADLPVLTQMALNIAALVSTLEPASSSAPRRRWQFRIFPRRPAKTSP